MDCGSGLPELGKEQQKMTLTYQDVGTAHREEQRQQGLTNSLSPHTCSRDMVQLAIQPAKSSFLRWLQATAYRR